MSRPARVAFAAFGAFALVALVALLVPALQPFAPNGGGSAQPPPTATAAHTPLVLDFGSRVAVCDTDAGTCELRTREPMPMPLPLPMPLSVDDQR